MPLPKQNTTSENSNKKDLQETRQSARDTVEKFMGRSFPSSANNEKFEKQPTQQKITQVRKRRAKSELQQKTQNESSEPRDSQSIDIEKVESRKQSLKDDTQNALAGKANPLLGLITQMGSSLTGIQTILNNILTSMNENFSSLERAIIQNGGGGFDIPGFGSDGPAGKNSKGKTNRRGTNRRTPGRGRRLGKGLFGLALTGAALFGANAAFGGSDDEETDNKETDDEKANNKLTSDETTKQNNNLETGPTKEEKVDNAIQTGLGGANIAVAGGELGLFGALGKAAAKSIFAPLQGIMSVYENKDELLKTGAIDPINQAKEAASGLGKVFSLDDKLFSMNRIEGLLQTMSGGMGVVTGTGTQIGKAIKDNLDTDSVDLIGKSVDNLITGFGLWGEREEDRQKKFLEEQQKLQEKRESEKKQPQEIKVDVPKAEPLPVVQVDKTGKEVEAENNVNIKVTAPASSSSTPHADNLKQMTDKAVDAVKSGAEKIGIDSPAALYAAAKSPALFAAQTAGLANGHNLMGELIGNAHAMSEDQKKPDPFMMALEQAKQRDFVIQESKAKASLGGRNQTSSGELDIPTTPKIASTPEIVLPGAEESKIIKQPSVSTITPEIAPLKPELQSIYQSDKNDSRWFKGDTNKLTGMDTSMVDALKTASMSSNQQIQLLSGYRSQEKQDALFQQKLKETGGDEAAARKWVAKQSIHTTGKAVDIGPYASEKNAKQAKEWWDNNPQLVKSLEAQGLHRPLAHEPWHWESAETKGQDRKGLAEKLINERKDSIAQANLSSANNAPALDSSTQTQNTMNPVGSPVGSPVGPSIPTGLPATQLPQKPGSVVNNPTLGSLSAKYESGKAGSSAIGWDSTGGTSFGKYQLASKTGTVDKFLNFVKDKNPEVYDRLKNAGPADSGKDGAFAKEWKSLAKEGKLGNLEHDFMEKTNYSTAMKGIKNPEVQKMINENPAMQDVLWSTAIQHGGKGASDIFNKTYKEGMSSEDMINSVYDERGKHFKSSTAKVQESVKNRFVDEKKQALAMNESIKNGSATKIESPTTDLKKTDSLAAMSPEEFEAQKKQMDADFEAGEVGFKVPKNMQTASNEPPPTLLTSNPIAENSLTGQARSNQLESSVQTPQLLPTENTASLEPIPSGFASDELEETSINENLPQQQTPQPIVLPGKSETGKNTNMGNRGGGDETPLEVRNCESSIRKLTDSIIAFTFG